MASIPSPTDTDINPRTKGKEKTSTQQNDKDLERSFQEHKELISSLPKEKGWMEEHIHLYQGFWYHPSTGAGVMNVQKYFKPKPTDIFIASFPKCGTIWLKAILFATMNRTKYKFSTHPLLTTNPHDCVPFLELTLFEKPPFADVENMPSPRLFGTHIPYNSLPNSITNSGCRIVYICRNPKDVLVSMWHFMSKLREKTLLPPLSFEEAFELFSQGKTGYGPVWDHAHGYKRASSKWADRVLFMKYEEMKIDTVSSVRRLAEFLGEPFSSEEEDEGVVDDIVNLCSFGNLKKAELNKFSAQEAAAADLYFRQGKVGDWNNYLTSDMTVCLDEIIKEKLNDIFP